MVLWSTGGVLRGKRGEEEGGRGERRREEEGGRGEEEGGRGGEKRKEGEGEVKTGEGQYAVNETISTCCSLGPGLDALTVHHHLLPIYCDLGQPFIIRPHTVGEDLGQS